MSDYLGVFLFFLPPVLQFVVCLLTDKTGLRAVPMAAMVVLWFISVVFALLGGSIGTRFLHNTIGASDQQTVAIYGIPVILLQVLAWRAGDYIKSQL